ncbi:MAG: porin, partial [Flavobacterium sp.]
KVRIQPFGAFTYKDFDALKKSSTQFDVGTNFLLDGQHSKITAQYSTRPVYSAPGVKESSKGEFVVQLQIYL